MTTLIDAISCPLCSLRRRVRITHLRRKQATTLFLHQALSFLPTCSLYLFFTAWWTCDALWSTIDLFRWILDLLCFWCRVCERLCDRHVIYMWYCLCDEMDVIYMCYIVFVMSQMLYISLICCVCKYRIKKKLASLPSALTLALGKAICRIPNFVECQGQGTRQRFFFKKYLPSAALTGHSAKKLRKKF